MNTYNANDIAAILFNLDPMSTACVQNGLFQEYQVEAFHIAGALNEREPNVTQSTIEEYVTEVFGYYFWENCITKQQIEEITNEISKSAGVYQRP